MKKNYSSWLRITFLLNFLIGAVLGINSILPNDLRLEYTPFDPWYGAVLLTFSIGSFLAYRNNSWYDVNSFVKMSILFYGLSSLATIWDSLYHTIDGIYAFYGLYHFIFFAGFAISFYIENYVIEIHKKADLDNI